jgi:hypothetical protein
LPDKFGVVNDVTPMAIAVPPDGEEYQSMVSPAPAFAEIVTVPEAHLELPVPVGGFGKGFTTRVTEQEF